MTTGATGQLGLALPVQGELSGTWGDTVNNGITQYTNIAIAGTLTLTGDGAVTLANTTGDASASNITSSLTGAGTVTAQFAIVKVTGTLTVAKVVTGPSYSKTYTVVNAATGGIVTFKASGQTGVSVAVGETAFVYFNGTDYVKIVGTATAGAAGGSNTQVQFNSSGILSGSSSLTWDGTTLSSTQVNITGQGTLRLQDTTGGEYVGLRSPSALGASYTLTFPADDGTSGQALITDGSGVLSWSTAASGDVYGPGSSTDNAVARFDSTTGKLLQNSVVLIGDTGAVTGVTDLTASGTVTLSGGTANGVAYLNGSKVVTSGSALVFDGTKLLVGSNTAGYGTLNVARDTTTPYASLTITDEANAANTVGLYLRQSGSSPAGISTAGAPIAFYTGGAGTTEGMRLTSTGLGIGTSSPSAKLSVVKTGDNSRISIGDTASSTYSTLLMYGGAGKYNFQLGVQNNVNNAFEITPSTATGGTTFSTPAFVLDSSGNVGIGTSSPGVKLDVVGGIRSNVSGGTPIIYWNNGTSQHSISNSAGTMPFAIDGGEQMRLTSTGLGIGTSSPATRLSVDNTRSDTAGTGWFTYTNAAVTSGKRGMRVDTNNGYWFDYYDGSTWSAQMGLDTSGNLGLGVTPSAWATLKAIEIAGAGNTVSGNGTSALFLSNNAYFNSSWKYANSSAAASQINISGGGMAFNIAASGTAGNAITFTQAMTLDASSNLLLGTTSTTYGSIPGKFTSCSATAGSAGLFYTGFSGDVSTSALNIGKFDNDNSTSQIFVKFGINNAGTGSGQINANGGGAVAFGSFSDRRLKENIEPLASQLSSICALNPVEFDYKTGGHQIGFIAQEMQEIYPDTVGEDGDGMLSITGWSKTEARLVKAIQEQQAIINSLKARLDAANL